MGRASLNQNPKLQDIKEWMTKHNYKILVDISQWDQNEDNIQKRWLVNNFLPHLKKNQEIMQSKLSKIAPISRDKPNKRDQG